MFTGLIEEIGAVASLEQSEKGVDLTVRAQIVLGDVEPGASIAVNGVCLTVADFTSDAFTAGLAPETLRRTDLGDLEEGSRVNLERAATPSTRLGGHFVQGHVDGTGRIRSVEPDGDALFFRIETDPSLLRYMAPKGYIAVDGASLTLIDVDAFSFSLMLVRYTQEKITLAQKSAGDAVNIEVDILAKYVERMTRGGGETSTLYQTMQGAP